MTSSVNTEPSAAARRPTRAVAVRWGDHVVRVGGDAPVVVQSMTNTDTADPESTARQVRELAGALRGESALPLVLAGFSQGAVVSLAAAAQGVPGLIGVAAMSGYVPRFLLPVPADMRSVRVLMAHGEQDEVVPFALGKAGRDALAESGVAVDWRAYAMPHTICQQELRDVSGWLSGLLEQA